MLGITLLLLLVFSIAIQCKLDNAKLNKVFVHFMHGARYPNYNSKAPIYNTGKTKDNSRQLSPVGARQLFQLGNSLRNEYFTDKKTIMSAQSFMAGLYSAGTGPTILSSITSDNDKKKHLGPPYKKLATQPGDNNSVQNSYQPVPIRTVQNQYDGALYILGNAFVSTPFFSDLLKYIDNPHKPIFTVLSGHDITIDTVLQGLNLVSYQCFIDYINNRYNSVDGKVCFTDSTDFASNVIFELVTKDTKQYVQTKYKGVLLKICDQTNTYCEFSDFQNRVKSFIVPDYDVQCGNPIPQIQTQNPTPQSEQTIRESNNSTPGWSIALIVIFGVLFGQKQFRKLINQEF
ncbi:hypothetical protein ABPG72_021339 [Tetrahymena utriculariae]